MAIENGVQNAELGYILDPAFQIENLNGKPVVGGYICVYEAGTDNKYISYENFDGAQNPFKIPLKADGRAVILGDPSLTYDVYFYDSYGNQLFSRLNVQCNVPGTINLSGVDTRIKNTDGTLDISLQTLGNNVRQYTVNTHNKRLDVQSPLYFVENSNTATVIGFSGDGYVSSSTYNTDITNITNNINTLSADVTGKMDVDKLEFSNNKITGYDGSAFAGGGSVDPSEFVPWSASGAFQPSGNYYSASNPSGFINSDAISSMATTGFVADVSAEITALIPTAVTGDYLTKASADTLYYPLNSNPSGYLTAHQDLSDLMPKSESANFYPMTGNPSGFLTAHQSLEGYATTEDLESATSGLQEKGDYYSASNPSGFITGVDLTPYQTTAGMTAYATTALVSSVSSELYSAISGISGDYELVAGEGVELVDDPINKTTTINVTAQLTGDYVTHDEMTGYQPVGSYLTADALDNVSGDWNEVSAKLDTTAFSDVSGTFLTAHQDISNKLDTTAFSDVSGSFLTAIPDTYLQNTDLSTEDGKVTAISGIPLSAGGDVPEGVMVESGLEYNAVNEISGYNGSAIAQYGAEKQWLTHDDTIVHVSNSAQYAFGVNLSGISADLARMMSVDETLLWSGNSGQLTADRILTLQLTEAASSFEKVEIYNNCSYGNGTHVTVLAHNDSSENNQYPISVAGGNADGNSYYVDKGYVKFSGTSAIFGGGSRFNFTSPTTGNISTNRGFTTIKIIGIGRKS